LLFRVRHACVFNTDQHGIKKKSGKKIKKMENAAMPSKRNHSRAADKGTYSVALPKTLAAKIQAIADEERRSRNGQIEHFLQLAIRAYESEVAATDPAEKPKFAENRIAKAK
jgi:hypothetical protein